MLRHYLFCKKEKYEAALPISMRSPGVLSLGVLSSIKRAAKNHIIAMICISISNAFGQPNSRHDQKFANHAKRKAGQIE